MVYNTELSSSRSAIAELVALLHVAMSNKRAEA